jgi:hypothetical protein
VDAIIGLSIVYKAFENVGGFKTCLGWQPNPKAAVFLFGLAHGFGLATKLQDLALIWRSTEAFNKHSYGFNLFLMFAGFTLFGYQLSGYFFGAQ